MGNYIKDEVSNWWNTVTADKIHASVNIPVDNISWTVVKKTHDAPIKKVIFNYPATIVFWDDGSKTVVKCSKNDIYDREKGLAMAIAKYCLGNNGKLKSIFKKFVKDE